VLVQVLLCVQVLLYVHIRDREHLIIDLVHICNASSTKTSTVRGSGGVRALRAARIKIMTDLCRFYATAPVANPKTPFSVVYRVFGLPVGAILTSQCGLLLVLTCSFKART
jgi:hypothetical protein